MTPAEFVLVLLLTDGTQAVSDKTWPKIAECREIGSRAVAANPEIKFDKIPFVCVTLRQGTKTPQFFSKPH